MTNFKDHKVSVTELLGFIPEALLSHLSTSTKVDHYSKVLHGKKSILPAFVCYSRQ